MANKKFKIPVDSSEVKKATEAIEDLGGAAKGTKKEVTDLGATFEDVYGEGAKPLTEKLGELEDRMYALAEAGKQNSKEFKDLSAEAGRLRAVQQETDLVVDRLGKTFGQKLTGGVQTAVDAFTIAQVTLEAVGIESEGTAALMEKLFIAQSAADAFSSLEESTGIVTKLGNAIKATSVYQKASAIATKAVTAANWLWNAALTANPIGAIIVAVTALIAAGYALVQMFQRANKVNKEAEITNTDLNNRLERQNEIFKENLETIKQNGDNRLRMAKATGATKDEIIALRREIANETVEEAKRNLEVQKSILLENERALELAKNNGARKKQIEALEETLEKSQDAFDQANADFIKSEKAKKQLEIDLEIEAEAEKTRIRQEAENNAARAREDQRKKIQDERKKAEEEEKARIKKAQEEKEAADKKALESYKSILDETQDANEDYLQKKSEGETYEYNESVRAAKESYDERISSLQNALDRGVISEAEFNQTRAALDLQLKNELKVLDDAETERLKQKAKDQEAIDKDLAEKRKEVFRDATLSRLDGIEKEKQELEFTYDDEIAKLRENLENKLITQAEFDELEKQATEQKAKEISEIEKRNAQETKDAKIAAQLEFVNAVGGAVSALGGLFEEGTAAAKAAALADIAIGTAVGFIQGLDIAQKSAKGTGPGAALAFPIFYATQIAAVLAAAGKAKQALSATPGGSGGAIPTRPTEIGETSSSIQSAPIPPSISLFGSANESSAIGIGGQSAGSRQTGFRAYVVESDITDTQNTLNRYKQRSEIG